ncbi:ArsS family sensor histidine kinase [Aliarcobacter thereius]|uniref:histidine kinase n=2 Tax=Aliarcobacter thereius TaxID=544718 RepID=A0A1C0B8G1_9BACT|nr:ArsS family sensor histidine kinase [Aliarcobacter thereius]OCL93812.1 Sensor protein BasS [Aliarcobacter thereius]OCL95220.1 Sensor protein BasS [Aliarcobacter thereius LMG 24486]OCL99889.1 Sensor protein BasS [Aliarcobacter thereius]QBF16790.1 two-component system sensor histidine kinase [Aliarcobacter thereius LMG 24486]TLS73250.1 HAMP domain-containing histidine kinase [Aliarcobacter thereius]
MIRNISISTFVNIIFAFAFLAIFLTFATFISYDKQRHDLNLQSRYELIAENFLILFQEYPTSSKLNELYNKLNVKPIEKIERKLEIINNAQELTINQNYLGTYRVYKFDEIYYIYVQQYGYNIMLKDTKHHNYNVAFIIIGLFISLAVFLILYEIINRKLRPLKELNRKIIEFSNGNKDIKLEYKSKDEVGTIAKNFNEAINIINNQSKSKDLFMRNMMHELKTPITKAMFIAEGLDDKKTRDNLQRAFKRMDDIIKELATVEKITSKSTILYKEKVNFETIFNKTLDLMLIDSSKIETKIEDFYFNVDIYMISIALKNLIDNAIKFSSDKKAIVNANKSVIKIISKAPELKNDLIFYTDAFYQEDKRSSGFGLGLYIVKAIVNLHKFNLTYEHQNGFNIFSIKII